MTRSEWIGAIVLAGSIVAYAHTMFAADKDVQEAEETVAEVAAKLSEVATQQAVTQQQLEQLVEAAKLSREEAKEYREALIRLEERTRDRGASP